MSDGERDRPAGPHAVCSDQLHRFEPIILTTNSLRGTTLTRQAKRAIPETLKDDKYWERRKKNNMAAKRSRENRRRFELDVRLKLEILEKENILLKKEVSVMKSKFGIPIGHSMLTDQEKLECLNEFKMKTAEDEGDYRQGLDDSETNSNTLNTSVMVPHENQYSENQVSLEPENERNSPIYIGYERRPSYGNSPEEIVWSTVNEEQSRLKHTESHRQFTIEGLYPMPNMNSYNSTEEKVCHCMPQKMIYKDHEQGSYIGPNRKQAHVSANVFLSKPGDFGRRNNTSLHIAAFREVTPPPASTKLEDCVRTSTYGSTYHDDNDTSNSYLERQELRRKIMQLSAQCEEMRALVFKT